MTAQRILDSVTLDASRVSDAGYLEGNARTARVGIQRYLGSEVGKPEIPVVNVYRDEAEVFSKASLGTFSKIPITNDHPAGPVTSENWKEVAVGTTGDEVLRDGEYLKIGLKITDRAAVDAVRAGKRELSVGYQTELVWEDGVAPDGTPYQAKQTAIVADHIAIVARGRAGPNVRIGDEAGHPWGAAPLPPNPIADGEADMPNENLKTVVVDGLSVSTTDQGAQAIAKLQKDAETAKAALDAAVADHAKAVAAKDDEHTKAIEAKDTQIGELKAENAKLKDSAPKPADIDKLVADRAALVGLAAKIAPDVKTEGLSDDAIRKAVVSDRMGAEAVADASDAEVKGMFKVIAADKKASDPVADALRGQQPRPAAGGGAKSIADEAYADMLKQQSEAWRNPGAAPTTNKELN